MDKRVRRLSRALLLLLTLACCTTAVGQRRPEAQRAPARRVAVTFDDLPLTGGGPSTGESVLAVNRKILDALKANNVPAVGFVNENKLEGPDREARTAALKLWLDAGMELGNHTYSHKYFYRTPVAEFEQDVIKGEPITRSLLEARGMKLRYFRHPFLNPGRTLADKQRFEKFLAGRGYIIAPVTIDNSEWIFAREYAKALAGNDAEKTRRVAAEYVPYMETMFEFYEKLSADLFGREIPQILLVHANHLNADRFGELIAMMRRRGYAFVTLEEALRDQAYRSRDEYVGPVGISWLHRWALAMGKEFRKEPYLPEYMRQFDSSASGSDFKSRPVR